MLLSLKVLLLKAGAGLFLTLLLSGGVCCILFCELSFNIGNRCRTQVIECAEGVWVLRLGIESTNKFPLSTEFS